MNKAIIMSITLLLTVTFSGCGEADQVDSILREAQFDGKAVMLELGSVGCIPCERMKPVLEKLQHVYRGKLEVIFVDVRKDRENARRFGITVIPTQVFLDKNGEEFHRHMGYYAYEEIELLLRTWGL